MKTNLTLAEKIESVKTSAATKLFWAGVAAYGSQVQALRAYDSQTVEEAINMLKNAVQYSITKLNGEVIVLAK